MDVNDATPPATQEPDTRWMVTFADLVALLLTFFVMLYAMQLIEGDKWQALIESLTMSLNPGEAPKEARPVAELNSQGMSKDRAINLGYLEAILTDNVVRDSRLRGLALNSFDDRLVIVLPKNVMFPPNGAMLTEEAKKVMFSLGAVLGHLGNAITVHGHAGGAPDRGGVYSSNWELSLARSISVANELRRAGYQREIKAFGFGATRFLDLAKVTPVQRRDALARRVDIIVSPTLGTK